VASVPCTTVAFVLGSLGRGVIGMAEAASNICHAISTTAPGDRPPLPAYPNAYNAPAPLAAASAADQQQQSTASAPPSPPAVSSSRRAAPAPLDPESDASIGRSLAIQQMLQRSASAAQNSRRIESQRSDILQQKQSEAVARYRSRSRSRLIDLYM